MENKLKISENTVVHCETEELANEVLQIVDSLGYRWLDGTNLLDSNDWNVEGKDTVYEFDSMKKEVSLSSLRLIDKIKSAQDFIDLHDKEEQNIALYKKEMEAIGYTFDTMKITDVDECIKFLDKQIELQEGIKESNGKKDYSEINLKILDLMADRFAANKHKYPKGNMKKPIDVKSLEWALFRHSKKLVQPIENDEESYTDHLSAILCNASMILDQLKHNEKTKS